MNKKLTARELILIAKDLLADTKYDYVYDPDHKNKPKGGHWEKTKEGWSQNKNKKKPKTKERDIHDVIKDKNTDSKTLEKIFYHTDSKDVTTLNEIAGNPNATEELLSNILRKNSMCNTSVYNNPNYPIEKLREIADNQTNNSLDALKALKNRGENVEDENKETDELNTKKQDFIDWAKKQRKTFSSPNGAKTEVLIEIDEKYPLNSYVAVKRLSLGKLTEKDTFASKEYLKLMENTRDYFEYLSKELKRKKKFF